MSTTPPALGDIQKQIQDKVAQIRARIADLKSQLPFKPPGFLDQPILQRGTAQGQARFKAGGLLQRRPLLTRSSTSNPARSQCTSCQRIIRPPPPPLQGAIVDGRRPGPAVAEDIDPVGMRLSVAT